MPSWLKGQGLHLGNRLQGRLGHGNKEGSLVPRKLESGSGWQSDPVGFGKTGQLLGHVKEGRDLLAGDGILKGNAATIAGRISGCRVAW